MRIGRKIAELRNARGLTQAEFADQIGVSTKHLCQLEKGRKFPRWQMLVSILNQFEVTIQVGGEHISTEPSVNS